MMDYYVLYNRLSWILWIVMNYYHDPSTITTVGLVGLNFEGERHFFMENDQNCYQESMIFSLTAILMCLVH